MGITTRPSKKFDLSKIEEIQNEFFDDSFLDENNSLKKEKKNVSEETAALTEKTFPAQKSVENARHSLSEHSKVDEPAKSGNSKQEKSVQGKSPKDAESEQGAMKIAELLATEKTSAVRYTSRPYTIPRSLTIDLTRLKSKFRSRNLQYTQNELMDKMLNESLEFVTADNFLEERTEAFDFVKAPDQCSRRSVTLREETVSEMNELKADLAHNHHRRFSSDEIFTALLAIAFSPLYKNELL